MSWLVNSLSDFFFGLKSLKIRFAWLSNLSRRLCPKLVFPRLIHQCHASQREKGYCYKTYSYRPIIALGINDPTHPKIEEGRY